MARLRGAHWLMDPKMAEAAIGEPVADWIGKQPMAFERKLERVAGGLGVGIGLAFLAAPIIMGELALYEQRKRERMHGFEPSDRAVTATTFDEPADLETDRPYLPNTSGYSATLGFAPTFSPAPDPAFPPGGDEGTH